VRKLLLGMATAVCLICVAWGCTTRDTKAQKIDRDPFKGRQMPEPPESKRTSDTGPPLRPDREDTHAGGVVVDVEAP
jgi:hypothetical protein